ncbi:hypothetical protein [Lysobacter gummosus]|uniref:hypothetical protein n=1 Tax=Lysobacter gummosus TaxID=262324 RepID=UPI003643F576
MVARIDRNGRKRSVRDMNRARSRLANTRRRTVDGHHDAMSWRKSVAAIFIARPYQPGTPSLHGRYGPDR